MCVEPLWQWLILRDLAGLPHRPLELVGGQGEAAVQV